MDIKELKAEFEKLKYIEEKLEYLNFDEHLDCYVEKSNGMPVRLAAWVNGAFYGFEQAATAQAAPEGFVLVPKDKISHFYQDNDEPENFCNSSNDWDCLGERMDIQKEKIAHEKHLLSQGVDFKYLPNIQYSELENVYELIEWDEEYSEALNEINSSWCTWQAAKAQAVPETQQALNDRLLVKSIREHVESHIAEIRVNDLFDKGWLAAMKCIQNNINMLEAQEPAND